MLKKPIRSRLWNYEIDSISIRRWFCSRIPRVKYQRYARQNLEKIMNEINRVLRPNGSIIILETLGTGTETPIPPQFLEEYYALLEQEYGFSHRWIRMDYTFADTSEAKDNTEFFFGTELGNKIDKNQWSTVPECAGIWWKYL